MDPIKVMLPELQRRADFVPSTWNEAERTVDVTFASDTPVERASFFEGPWKEVLGLAPGEMRHAADGKVDVMYGHGLSGADPRMSSELKRPHIGTASAIRVVNEGGVAKAVATVRFSKRAEVADIVNDVRDGILTGISAGYRVSAYKDVTPAGAATKTRRAVAWTIREMSFLPLRADLASTVRSEEAGCEQECRVLPSDSRTDDEPATENARGTSMTPEEIAAKAADDKRAADAATEQRRLDDKRIADAATAAELERSNAIRVDVRASGLEDSVADELVKKGATVDAARKDILVKLRERSEASTQRPAVKITSEAIDFVRSGVQEALEVRAGLLEPSKVSDNGKRFVGMRMLRMCEEIIAAKEGRIDDHTPMGVARRALGMTGSDFPKITENVANKALRARYMAAAPTYRKIGRRATASDFKPMSRLQIGLGSALTAVQENGEISYATMSESKETYSLGTFGKLLGLTRQAIINDDTGAFDRVPGNLGGQAANKENALAWAIFTANAALGDTIALFHASHANDLSPATALGEAVLSAGRTAMRKQTDPDGTILNLVPRYLIVPAALETTAWRNTVADVSASSAANVSPFKGLLEPIVEPILDAAAGGATRFFLAASTEQIDVLEYSFLDGRDGPSIESFTDPKFDGVMYRVLHDFAVAVLDFRGLVRSEGTA